VPFVGVVPAIKPAALLSTTKKIGLLATPATVRRPYIDELIADFAADCEVLRVGSNELVILAEKLFLGQTVSAAAISDVLSPFTQSVSGAGIDTIVLGCTHFPLLKQAFCTLMPEINWIDSGEAVARRVSGLLSKPRAASVTCEKHVHQLYFSGEMPEEAIFKSALYQLNFHHSFQQAHFFSASIE